MSTVFQTINPTNGQLVKTFSTMPDEILNDRVELARSGFQHWRKSSFKERSALLQTLAQELEKNTSIFAQLMALEMGKPVKQGEAEIAKCATTCRYFAQNGESFLSDDTRPSDAKHSYVSHQPLGPIFSIAPWNFPFWQVLRFAIPALMAGNVVLLKHAANTPQCAQAIAQLFVDIQGPSGLLQNLFISHEQAAKLIGDPRIRGVSLTGSSRAGEQVAQLAGKHLKKMVMELGGSDPFIVFEDAHMEQAAQVAALARCQNSGQSCIAAKRFLVHESVYQSFLGAFIKHMKAQQMGDPSLADTQIGPLANKMQQELLVAQVEDARKKGAAILCGGQKSMGPGYFFPPTVIADIRPDMRAFGEELFGPVAQVLSFQTDDEALALADASEFGLGASIWTKNQTRMDRFIKDLDFGSVFVNAQVRSDPRLPFGGVKSSGFGRELGKEGILEFVNAKSVAIYS